MQFDKFRYGRTIKRPYDVCQYPSIGIVPKKTNQSVSMVNENVSGLLHGDRVINMKGIVLGPFP